MILPGLIAAIASKVPNPSGFWEFLLGLFGFIQNYGVRIIVFTVILKLLLLPLDFYQKYRMKKNERITKGLKPEIDKLQRVYANDKLAFQRAQGQLNKSAGVKQFATCLPMLVTLVIFITLFGGMRNISQYEEFKQYVNLYNEYSSRYTQLTDLDMNNVYGGFKGENSHDEFNQIIINWGTGKLDSKQQTAYAAFESESRLFKNVYDEFFEAQNYTVFFSNSSLRKAANRAEYEDATLFVGTTDLFNIETIKDKNTPEAQKAKAEIINKLNAALKLKDYGIGRTEAGGTLYDSTNVSAGFLEVAEDWKRNETAGELEPIINTLLKVADDEAASASYDSYKENRQGFLWIKSLWAVDAWWKDAVPNFKTFKSNVPKYLGSENKAELNSTSLKAFNDEENYNRVMLKIRQDKSLYSANGFLILAVISVGLSFLSQFITMRQQKKSGQVMAAGAGTNKMMMLLMPAMSAFFALMYTAAFAVYMVVSSAMTLLINLLTTAVIGYINKNKYKSDYTDDGIVRYGRRDPNDYINKGDEKND